jgi:hypothetical protein
MGAHKKRMKYAVKINSNTLTERTVFVNLLENITGILPKDHEQSLLELPK